MAKFRKKPVEVEAVQFAGKQSIPDILDFTDWAVAATGRRGENNEVVLVIEIETMEGTMTAQVGDWIIRGVKGELYPCKPDIFAATYDPVN